MRLAVLGCGRRATRVLQNVIGTGQTRISHITACVRSDEAFARTREEFKPAADLVRVIAKDHCDAAASADAVLLGHKRRQLGDVLAEAGMAEALRGKKIISMLPRASMPQLSIALSSLPGAQLDIILARPSVSLTLLCDHPDASAELKEFATWFFERVGPTALVTETAFDVGTVLARACGSFSKTAMDGLIDAGLNRGLPREAAIQAAAQCLEGLTGLLKDPGDSISTPGGGFERYVARSALADAIVQTVAHTKQLG